MSTHAQAFLISISTLSALVSAHSLSSTPSLNVLILMIFATRTHNYFVASSMEELFRSVDICNVLISSKKLIFITSYDVVRFYKVAK